MNPFDRFRSLLKKKSSTAAELADAVGVARNAWQAAKERADKEQLLHPQHLLAGSADATKHKQLIAELVSDAQDAAVFLAALEERHAETLASEAEAARQARYDAAAKLSAEVAGELATQYPELAIGLLRLLHRVTCANEAIARANEDLPSDGHRLMRPEEIVRDAPDVPRKNVRQRAVSLWTFADGKAPLSDDQQERVSSNDGRTGSILSGPNDWTPAKSVVKKRFLRTEYLDAISGLGGARLVDMKIPSLKAEDPDYWKPGDIYRPTPADTLRRLEAAIAGAGPGKPAERLVKVEYVLTEQPIDDETD